MNKSNWLKANADKFTTPIERDAAFMAGLSIADFRNLNPSRRAFWKSAAYSAYKARKSN